jgi:hypothetical protein
VAKSKQRLGFCSIRLPPTGANASIPSYYEQMKKEKIDLSFLLLGTSKNQKKAKQRRNGNSACPLLPVAVLIV